MDYLKDGWHRDRIAARCSEGFAPSFDVQAAIDYIAAYREEVEAEYQSAFSIEHHNFQYTPEVQAKLDEEICGHRKFVEFVKELRNGRGLNEERDAADHG